MIKRRYEEPTVEVILFEGTGNIVTWSNGNPDNLEETPWDEW